MYRAGLITKDGIPKAKNFETKAEAEDWILEIAVKEGIRQARIRNLETKEEENIDL
jgi:hypothetical protein